ncbi:MAG: hypothetical protein HC803_01305 [Saprospiraceae bacterium]|nr:hypothetical protein [Saprospiraceae bacterium]
MRILNPIYDTVFKYLMEDIEIAKGLIASIIEQDVVELVTAPQEETSILLEAKYMSLAIRRLDYVAHIKSINTDGTEVYEKVMIEVQKSPFVPEIGRFRNYLAEKYKGKSVVPSKNGTEEKYLPLKTIYLIEDVFNKNLPSVLKRGACYYDVINQKEYTGEKDNFVELLTHESWFIQVRQLPEDMQNSLLNLLSIFTPLYRSENQRYLDFPIEEDELEKIKNRVLRRILRRLLSAVTNDKVKSQMEMEIEYEDYIERMMAENERMKEEKGQMLEEKKQMLEKEEQMKINLLNSAKTMKSAGLTIEIIEQATGLTKTEIENL